MADEQETAVVETDEKDTGSDAVSEDLLKLQDDFDSKIESDTDEPSYSDEEDDDIEVESDDDSDEKSADDDKDDADEKPGTKPDSDEKSAISDDLIRRAERLGLDADEAKAFKSPDTLEKVLSSLEGEQGEETPKPDQQPDNPFKFKLSLSKDEYDDHMVDQFEAMNDHYAQQITRLYQAVDRIFGERDTAKFDGMVDRLGSEWESVFGKGSESDLDPTSTEFKARARLYREMNTIQQGRAKLGKPPLPAKEAFEKALHGEFHKEFQKIKDGELGKKLKTRKRQMLNRPTRRQGKQLTGYEEAVQISQDFDALLDNEGYDG